MRCDEFVRRLNKQLDRDQPPLGDDVAEHLLGCDACRRLASTFYGYVDLLHLNTLSPSDNFTDEVILKATESRNRQRRQQAVVWCSFAATLAAGLLVMASIFTRQDSSAGRNDGPTLPSFPSASFGEAAADAPRTAMTGSGLREFDERDRWNEWYDVARQLPRVHQMWTETWLGAESNSPVAASVTSGLRPVATTMSSAIKVIGQRILPTSRTSPTDEGQAAGVPTSSTLV